MQFRAGDAVSKSFTHVKSVCNQWILIRRTVKGVEGLVLLLVLMPSADRLRPFSVITSASRQACLVQAIAEGSFLH